MAIAEYAETQAVDDKTEMVMSRVAVESGARRANSTGNGWKHVHQSTDKPET
jgi:hypothetical protein